LRTLARNDLSWVANGNAAFKFTKPLAPLRRHSSASMTPIRMLLSDVPTCRAGQHSSQLVMVEKCILADQSRKRISSAEAQQPSRPSPAGGAARAGLDRRHPSAGIELCAGTEERFCAQPKNGAGKAPRALRCYRRGLALPDHRPYLRAPIRSEVQRRHAWFRWRLA
jgi:hypothetical protein